jgi:hypothetical protein
MHYWDDLPLFLRQGRDLRGNSEHEPRHAAARHGAAGRRGGGHPSRLQSAAAAFLDYYLQRPVEIGLSLYLFDGVRPTSLTPRLNDELNGKLMAPVQIVERLICRIAGGMSKEDERTEGAMLFSYLMGLTIVHHTGRTRTIERPSSQLLAQHVEHLIKRLQRDAQSKRC